MGLMLDRMALAMALSRPIPDGCVRGDINLTAFREMARAALEEMREPTVDMLEAFAVDYDDYGSGDPALVGTGWWQIGIDAALGKVETNARSNYNLAVRDTDH